MEGGGWDQNSVQGGRLEAVFVLEAALPTSDAKETGLLTYAGLPLLLLLYNSK